MEAFLSKELITKIAKKCIYVTLPIDCITVRTNAGGTAAAARHFARRALAHSDAGTLQALGPVAALDFPTQVPILPQEGRYARRH